MKRKGILKTISEVHDKKYAFSYDMLQHQCGWMLTDSIKKKYFGDGTIHEFVLKDVLDEGTEKERYIWHCHLGTVYGDCIDFIDAQALEDNLFEL